MQHKFSSAQSVTSRCIMFCVQHVKIALIGVILRSSLYRKTCIAGNTLDNIDYLYVFKNRIVAINKMYA